jgi:hypothetical protein
MSRSLMLAVLLMVGALVLGCYVRARPVAVVAVAPVPAPAVVAVAPPPGPPPGPPSEQVASAMPIAIVAASYGTNCAQPNGNVTTKVASVCNGRPSCSFVADNGMFGDPAVGCAKNFIALWRCGGTTMRTAPLVPRGGEGYAVSIACP